jgi:hypothetical protein
MPTALSIVQKFYPKVRTVMDGSEPVTIEVSRRDCESKAVKNHRECALALACKRHFEINGVVIALRVAYLVNGNKAYRYGLGEAIAREITAFDRNGGFEPGEYTLLVPSHRIGDPRSSGGRKYTKGGKPQRRIEHRHITTDVRTLLV